MPKIPSRRRCSSWWTIRVTEREMQSLCYFETQLPDGSEFLSDTLERYDGVEEVDYDTAFGPVIFIHLNEAYNNPTNWLVIEDKVQSVLKSATELYARDIDSD